MCKSSRMASNAKKDSTNELPMFDLEEAIKLVVTIHEKALETASMQDVAKGCGYANPTSTPFYRRIASARLFKLLSSPKPGLTKMALDYLKPETDDAKQNALTEAITGISAYDDLVQKHIGKRVSTELVSNGFAKAFALTDACATQCARVLISSLKFAKFISPDGTVVIPSGSSVKPLKPPPDSPPHKDNENEFHDDSIEGQSQTLYLDSKRKRKITIKAPLTVTKDELERIRSWLGFQLIVEESRSDVAP